MREGSALGTGASAKLSPSGSCATPNLAAEDHAQHPAGRVGKPEEAASLVAYLAPSEAEFITGQNFTVDGGMSKKMIYIE